MNRIPIYRLLALVMLAALVVVAPSALAKKKSLPQTSKEGLELKHSSKQGALYIKEGASLEDYKRVTMTDVYVAFKKNWQRNYNQDVVGLEGRVTDKDVETIKNRLAKEFKVVFTKELEKAGYEVVDSAASDVLLLRPAIIDLVVTAPDIQRAGMTQTFVASEGEMTLYIELYDSLTSDLLAQAIDAEAARDGGIAHMGGRVANKQAADQILKRWAGILVEHLGKALE